MNENETTSEEVQDSPNFARLKKQLADVQAERDSYKTRYETARGQLVTNAAQLAGFQPDENGAFTGVAGLLLKEFQGSLTDDDLPTPQGFATLAQQYGVTAQAPAVEPTAQPSVADQLAQLQAPGDQLRQLAQAAEPVGDLRSRIADAESKGDWDTAGLLKDELLRQKSPA